MDNVEQPAGGGEARAPRTYTVNDNDVIPFVALVVSIIGALSCVTGGYICLVLPLVGIALGIAGWIQSAKAVNPGRAKTLAMISTFSMAAIFVLMVTVILAYFAFLAVLVIASFSSGSYSGYS